MGSFKFLNELMREMYSTISLLKREKSDTRHAISLWYPVLINLCSNSSRHSLPLPLHINTTEEKELLHVSLFVCHLLN